MEQVAVSKCDICKEDIAKVFCYECHQFLCQSCESIHEKFPATKRHTITDSHSIDRSTLIQKLVCEHHNVEFSYYCRDCECLICAQCVTSVHTGHSITNIAEVAGKAREVVKKRLHQIKDNIKRLSDLIEDFKTSKQADLQTGTDNFIKEVNEVSQDLIRIIESIAEINLTHASDLLVLEKQQLLYNVAKLEKSHSEYSSIQERYERILKDKHDVTFFLNQKSLSKDFELLDDISPPEEPKEIEPLNRGCLVDSVINIIESKYSTRNISKKDKQMESTENNSGKRKTVNLYPYEDKIITGQKDCTAVGIQIENEESGFAMSNFNDFEKDPLNTYIPIWRPKFSTVTRKMPNSILLDCEQTFVAFGHEAEDQYVELLELGSHHDCYFIKHFTKNISELMAKYENSSSEEGKLDITNFTVKTIDQKKEVSALRLMQLLINFYVDKVSRTNLHGIKTTNFKWVLTIPSYWNQSMRKLIGAAAKKNTIVISDPEAVSLYWKFWSVKNKVDQMLDLFQPERKYMVVNCSGDVIDLTCWKLEEDKSLRNMKSIVIVSEDLAFYESFKKFLVGIVGNNVYSKFCIQDPIAEKDFILEIQCATERFNSARNFIAVKLPTEFLEEAEQSLGISVKKLVNKTVYSNAIKWVGDKMMMDKVLFESLFLNKAITCVINSIKDVLKDPDVIDTSNIICSGQLMKIPVISKKLRETFHNINLIEFPEPHTAALRGAVILGHYPKVSCKRIFYRL